MRSGRSVESLLLGLALSIAGCAAASPPPEQTPSEGEVVAVFGNPDGPPQLAPDAAPTLNGATDAELWKLFEEAHQSGREAQSALAARDVPLNTLGQFLGDFATGLKQREAIYLAIVQQTQNPELAVLALIANADDAQCMADKLMAVEVPLNFTAEQRAVFQDTMDEYIAMLETKAKQTYDVALAKADEVGIDNAAVKAVRARFSD